MITSSKMPQAIVFPEDRSTHALRGKLKGAEALHLQELWPPNGRRSDGFKFLLQCPRQRGGCDANFETGCCAQQLLSQQQDFRN